MTACAFIMFCSMEVLEPRPTPFEELLDEMMGAGDGSTLMGATGVC